jgi:hypothetical protein
MKTDEMIDAKKLEKAHYANIMTAYSGGMSVIEITDALQAVKCQFVHDVLRRFNLISHVEKRDSKSAQELDLRLQSALKHRNYSFLLWCVGWGLQAAETAQMLKEPPGETLSTAHSAVKRDFPEVYGEIFDAMPPVRESWRVRTRTPRLSLNVVWDEDHRGYIASVPEVSGVLAKGNSWMEALEKMLNVQRLQRYIGLLSNVLEIRGMQGVTKSSFT